MSQLPHYPSLLQAIRAIAYGRAPVPGAREQVVRTQRLKHRLGELVAQVDPGDRGAIDRIRMRFLKEIALSEWGEAALSDHFALALLRSVDRLMAADKKQHQLMCLAIAAVRSGSANTKP